MGRNLRIIIIGDDRWLILDRDGRRTTAITFQPPSVALDPCCHEAIRFPNFPHHIVSMNMIRSSSDYSVTDHSLWPICMCIICRLSVLSGSTLVYQWWRVLELLLLSANSIAPCIFLFVAVDICFPRTNHPLQLVLIFVSILILVLPAPSFI